MKFNDDANFIYKDFSDKLRLLYQESFLYITEASSKNKSTQEKFKKLFQTKSSSDRAINKCMENLREERRGMWLQLNSNFIYSFALFESFISQVIRLSFRKNKNAQTEYIKYFKKFAAEKFEDGDKRFFEMLIDKNLMIESYDDLPSPLSLCKKMFNLKTDESPYKEYFFNFIEARERRNLLVHRGYFADRRYYKSIKNSLGKKWRQQAESFLKDKILTKELLHKNKNNKGDKIDLSITPSYLTRVFKTLFFMSSIIFLEAFKLSKSQTKQNISYVTNPIHEVMNLDHDRNLPVIIVVLDIWIYFQYHFKNDRWSMLSDYDKINLSLSLDRILNKYSIEKGVRNKFENISLGILESISDENFKNMAIAHNTNDPKTLLKYSKIMKLSKTDFEEFFIFKKYKKNVSLKNYFKKLT